MQDIFREMGAEALQDFDNNVEPTFINTDYIANQIRKSYVQPTKQDLMAPPAGYKSNSGYFMNNDIGNADKPSFETKNYNVEDAYARLNDGDYVRRYDSYQEGRDNAEFAAQSQSIGEKWLNGFTKFAGKVGTGIIGGTVGAVNGIFEGIKEGSFRATYDNQFNNYLDDLNERLDYQLPNYYTKKERDNSFFQSMGTHNFWADEVLGGAAFTVSAIGSEYVWATLTGGSSLGTTASRWGQRIASTQGRFGRALSEMAQVRNLASQPVLRTFANAQLPTKLATAIGKAGSLANTARFMYTSAGFEAGTEARAYIREIGKKFEQDFIDKNGYAPTQEDRDVFQKDIADSANSLYGFNMAVVGSSNLLTIGRIFDMKSPLSASSRWANSRLFGIGNNAETGVAQVATRAQKVARTSWSLGKSALIEGVWEEGMQSVGRNTAKHWIESTYDPKYLGNTIDISTAFNQGLSDTYGTKEGMKEVGIGMIIGLLTGGGISTFKNKSILGDLQRDVDNSTEIEKFYNSNYSPQQMSQALAYSGRIQSANENADVAEQKGDFLGGELSRQSAIIAQAAYAHNLDYFDETIVRTETGIRNIGDDIIMQQYGVEQSGVEGVKDQMVSDYRATMNSYKEKREFTDYYIGNNLSKQEKEMLGGMNLTQLKDAIAYELTLGEKTHSFSEDLLTSIKEEMGSSVFGLDINTPLNIEDVLLKAGEDTRREANKKESSIKRIEKRRVNLEREYKEVERTLSNTTDAEQRKKYLTQFDNLRSKITQTEQEKQQLTKDYNILLNTAKLRNPFGSTIGDLFITEENILNREADLKEVRNLVGQYNQTDAQKGLKLKKLLDEYSKTIYAFKRYADLSRQISDPKLSVRGRQNIITQLRKDKSPNEITVEFLEGIRTSETLQERSIDFISDRVSEVQDVQRIVTGDSIEAPVQTPESAPVSELDATIETINNNPDLTPEERQLAIQTQTERFNENRTPSDIKSYVTDLIGNSPYLLEYYGSEQVPVTPTQEEINEFESLARKALSDKKINKKTLSYEDPFSEWFPQDGRWKVNLTTSEIQRLQELNEKLANWRLLEVYGSREGVSVADMLAQEVITSQEVETVPQTPELTDNDLQSVFENNPTETETGEGIRPSDILQTYQDVLMSQSASGTNIHHLTVVGLLDRLPYTTVNYAKITSKGGKEKVVQTRDNIGRTEIESLSRGGARFIITFDDFTQSTVDVGKGGQLVFKDNEDYIRVFEKAGIETKSIQTDPNRKGKTYYPVYDLNTGKKLGTTFSDANSYSPTQLYELLPGQVVEFGLDLFTPENERQISQYQNEVENTTDKKRLEELDSELMANIQISVTDQRGQKLSDLKAAYDTDSNPQFLRVRLSALQAVKKALEEGISLANSKQKLPYQTSIRTVMLGTPNFQYEDGRIKFFDIKPDKIENYGYIMGGRLILKDSASEPIRKDFIKGFMQQDKVPFIVLRQGKYLIAVPIALNTVGGTIGTDFLQKMQQDIDSGVKNIAQVAVDINRTLLENNLSPKDYNLYFLDSENQTLFDRNGNITESFTNALDTLDSIRNAVDVSTWMTNNHTREMLAQEATSPIDTEDNVASSPKPIVNFTENGLTKLEGNWLDIAMRTGEISDENVTRVVDEVLDANFIDSKILELAQNNEKIQEALKEVLKIEPSLKRKLSGIIDDIDNC